MEYRRSEIKYKVDKAKSQIKRGETLEIVQEKCFIKLEVQRWLFPKQTRLLFWSSLVMNSVLVFDQIELILSEIHRLFLAACRFGKPTHDCCAT